MGPHQSPLVPCAAVPPRHLVILGQPVSQSLSPVFQGAALANAGFNVMYEPRAVAPEALAAAFARCQREATAGNVTMPHKAAAYALTSHPTAAARRTGAVNTFWFDGEELVGHNTDIDGVCATVRALCPTGVDGDIVLLGAGGAAAAVLVALDQLGVRGSRGVTVVSRGMARGEALLVQTGVTGHVAADPVAVDWSAAGLVINATPVGMRDDDALPVEVGVLAPHAAVFDLVYRRGGTAWVNAARARGLRAEDGLRMLIEQGAAAFACWFGREPSRAVMWRALGVPVPA
jgi:shikimate dehydrogenase